jgi:hypothetical protein
LKNTSEPWQAKNWPTNSLARHRAIGYDKTSIRLSQHYRVNHWWMVTPTYLQSRHALGIEDFR